MQERKNNITLSGIVLTFNQADNITSCLKFLTWCDEIVVVDSYSTDETLGKIRNKKIKIYKRKLGGDFAGQRNFAVEKASGDWILVLDADETLSANAGEGIEKLIKDGGGDGFWFPRRNYINEETYLQHGYFYPDWQLRLFKKKSFVRYKGLVHEYPIVRGSKKRVRTVEIFHNPSNSKYDSIFSFERFFPYIKIEARQKIRSGESWVRLVSCGLRDLFREFFWSFIRDKGYRDGYNGFRAALIYGMYKGAICYFALYLRLKS
jgi:glycosyltransferase involved in cell wall biosynthesis